MPVENDRWIITLDGMEYFADVDGNDMLDDVAAKLRFDAGGRSLGFFTAHHGR